MALLAKLPNGVPPTRKFCQLGGVPTRGFLGLTLGISQLGGTANSAVFGGVQLGGTANSGVCRLGGVIKFLNLVSFQKGYELLGRLGLGFWRFIGF